MSRGSIMKPWKQFFSFKCGSCGKRLKSSWASALSDQSTEDISPPSSRSREEHEYLENSSAENSLFLSEDYAPALFSSGAQTLNSRKRKRSQIFSGRFMLHDVTWAKHVSKKLKTVIDFQNPENVVVECNPGFGVLTKALLSRSKANILTLHYRRSVTPNILELAQNRYYRNRIFVEKGSIFQIRKHLNKINSAKYTHDFNFHSVSPVKVLGTTFPHSMLAHYINTLSFDIGAQNHIYSLGRVENFLFLPTSEMQVIGHKTKTDHLFNMGALRSALYKIFFQLKVLMKIPPAAFDIKASYSGDVYLVRLTPNYPPPCSPEQVPSVIHLLRELRKRRGQTVEDAINSLYPDMTPAVFSSGVSRNSNVSSLSVPEVLAIHKVLSPHLESLNFDPDEDLTLPLELDYENFETPPEHVVEHTYPSSTDQLIVKE